MKSILSRTVVLSMVVAISFFALPVSNCWSATEFTIIDLGGNAYGNPLAINQRGHQSALHVKDVQGHWPETFSPPHVSVLCFWQ